MEKHKVISAWNDYYKLISEASGTITLPSRSFEEEVKEAGGLDNLYAQITAKSIAASALEDPQFLIEFYLIYASAQWGWRELLPEVIRLLVEFPKAKAAIERGLEKICKYGSEYGQDKEIENLKELYDTAKEKQRQRQFAISA